MTPNTSRLAPARRIPMSGMRRKFLRAAAISAARQGYDGAGSSRLTGDWWPGGLDVNALIATASPSLRARVRDLVRNFPPFIRAVNGVVAFTVGKGSRFQSLAVLPNGEPDLQARRKIEDRFRAWMDTADVAGKLHFYELQQLAKRQECESGEYIARFTAPRRRRQPLAIQMLESESLSAWLAGERAKDTDIFQGVEYDIYTGEPAAYHFQTSYSWQNLANWREPAANVLHGFDMHRPGQLRGVTPFAPAVMLARDMGDYMGAEIDAAKMAAKWLAFVTSPNPEMYQGARPPGLVGQGGARPERQDIDWLENAAIEYLRVGEDIKIAPGSQRPGDAFDRTTGFILRMVAITMNLPYEILSGDYKGINYSTSKASRNDFSMFLVPHHFRLEAHFIRPVFHRWLDTEALTQDYLKGYFLNPDRFRKAMWIPAGMPSVDPLRDGKADLDAITGGIRSPQMVILGQGNDPEQVVIQRAEWKRLCEAYGVDATTGGVSTSLASNPAKLGAVEPFEPPVTNNPDQDTDGEEPEYA
ncbi:MAG: phage portal protein [Desulfovibrionaceae bacterium]|nr:phage portal protein [Desulfovibrionaceae bacterium]